MVLTRWPRRERQRRSFDAVCRLDSHDVVSEERIVLKFWISEEYLIQTSTMMEIHLHKLTAKSIPATP